MIKRRKPQKRNPIKTLKNKAERLWKEVCYLRYGRFCYVKRYYPYIKISHTDVIQIDHCITRGNKYFFLDPNNGTPVCSACNQAKCYGNKSVSRAIDEIVEKRNPEWYKSAVWLDQAGEPNANFSKKWWLEEKVVELEEELKRLKGVTD